MEKGWGNAFRIHTETFSLRSGIASEEFVRDPTFLGRSGDCLHLVQGVDYTGDLKIAPRVTSAAADRPIKQVQQRIFADQGGSGNGGNPADQAIFGVVEKIFNHSIVAEAVGNPEVNVRIEGTRKYNLALHIDLPLCLAEHGVGANGDDLFPLNRYSALDDPG